MKVYDCCMYFNELDLLKYRISHCYKFVDKFIIIDAYETHRGQSKESLDLNLIEPKFKDKIIYDCINFPLELNINEQMKNTDITNIAWKRERYQRDQIMKYLKDIENNDLCIISDLDEICNYSVLFKYLKKYNLFDKLAHHINPTFVYNIHFLQSDYWHACSFSAPMRCIRNKSLTDIRFSNKKKYINGVLQYWANFSMKKPSFMYTYNNMFCFNHFNRFCNPKDLFLKENAIVEGGDNHIISIKIIRENTTRILQGKWGNLIEVDYVFPEYIYSCIHKIHTMKKEELDKLWNTVKDLTDDEFIKWYNDTFSS